MKLKIKVKEKVIEMKDWQRGNNIHDWNTQRRKVMAES